MARHHDDQTERTIHIFKDVFALGLAIYPAGSKMQNMCRTVIGDMHGMDYAPVPYSLAQSMFQTLEVYVRQKLPYIGNATKLIEFNRNVGVIKMTDFGATVMKKLGDRVRAAL